MPPCDDDVHDWNRHLPSLTFVCIGRRCRYGTTWYAISINQSREATRQTDKSGNEHTTEQQNGQLFLAPTPTRSGNDGARPAEATCEPQEELQLRAEAGSHDANQPHSSPLFRCNSQLLCLPRARANGMAGRGTSCIWQASHPCAADATGYQIAFAARYSPAWSAGGGAIECSSYLPSNSQARQSFQTYPLLPLSQPCNNYEVSRVVQKSGWLA